MHALSAALVAATAAVATIVKERLPPQQQQQCVRYKASLFLSACFAGSFLRTRETTHLNSVKDEAVGKNVLRNCTLVKYDTKNRERKTVSKIDFLGNFFFCKE